MTDDSLEGRVEQLEDRFDAVEETLERYREQHALLLADADVDALGAPSCPECVLLAVPLERLLDGVESVLEPFDPSFEAIVGHLSI